MKKLLFLISTILISNYGLIAQPLLGLDVSHYDGIVNWTQVYTAGYKFAWAKATEGLSTNDAQYIANATNGVSAGVYMGAYHFAHPDVNSTPSGAIAEANHFLSIASPYIVTCQLPPVLDLEVSTSLTNAQLTAWVQTWMNTVQTATGIVPILYTSGSIAGLMGSSLSTYCKLWIADPDGSATVAPGASYLGPWNPNWAFKQYSWTGTVTGISTAVDLNVFNGNMAALQTLMGCGISTTTVCNYYYANLPYSTSFETLWITDSCSNGTQRIPDKFWKSKTGGTSPSNNDYWHREDYTGTDWTSVTSGSYTPTASLGSYSARFHNYPATAASTGALDLYINLSPSGNKQISFDYLHNELSPTPFSFDVLLSTDGGLTFSPSSLLSITTASVSSWTTQTFTTNATSATSVIRFIATDKGTHDVGIDNLHVVSVLPTGIENAYSQLNINLFPNPNNGEFTLQINGLESTVDIFIYNQMGQLILHDVYDNSSPFLNIKDLSKGIYFVSIENKGIKIKTQKVIVLDK